MDTSVNVEEWDTDHSMAVRQANKNILDNHSLTASCLSHDLKLDRLGALENATTPGTWKGETSWRGFSAGPHAGFVNYCAMTIPKPIYSMKLSQLHYKGRIFNQVQFKYVSFTSLCWWGYSDYLPGTVRYNH